MPDISRITLPSGSTYDIKDAVARQQIAGGVSFIGVTTTALTDGASTNPITINGESYTASNGDLVVYGDAEFIFGSANIWYKFGDTGDLGDLAYKDSASGTYTPAGSVTLTNTNTTATVAPAASGEATYTPQATIGAPTISVATAGATASIANPTSQTVAKTVIAAAPGETAPSNAVVYYSVSGETLSLYQLGYTTGDSITTTSVTVKTGDAAYEASAPSYTGTPVRLETGNISVPSSASFSGTQDTITVS